MKITVNWLRKYVEFDWDVYQLAERLTLLGIEVENVQKVEGGLEGVVIVKILSKDPHPNADRLSVCKVFDGKEERQIVCGATNFKAGDKAALILPGYILPSSVSTQPMVIKVSKIRGIESQGMLCSEKELGLSNESAGIMILPEDAPVGMRLDRYLERDETDYVLDLEITPNRGDLNSIIGIAREISALVGAPLTLPPLTYYEDPNFNTSDLVKVKIMNHTLCPRYIARIITDVHIKPSPGWLRWALEKVGMHSINNIVDITNYVMIETGQPLHAFDYNLITKDGDDVPTIIVRQAFNNEAIQTLDRVERVLSTEDLVIADSKKAIALAGIMGGADTQITPMTRNVLIESAVFNPINVRRTARRLSLHTEASYRFERGVDIQMVDWASRRCVQLIKELAGGNIATGQVDAYPHPIQPRRIRLRYKKVNALLGTALSPAEIDYYLGQLGLKKLNHTPIPVDIETNIESALFEIPTYRNDIKYEADLVEEVCRLYGVEKILPTSPLAKPGSHPFDTIHDQIHFAKMLLLSLGLYECQGQSLIPRAAALLMTADEELIELERPLSKDMDVLRPSLLPGLLDILRYNQNHQNYDLAFFEIGRVFKKSAKGINETRNIALALTGHRHPSFWQTAVQEEFFDIFDLKGIIETFLELFKIPKPLYRRRSQPTNMFIESALIQLPDGTIIGELGQIQPSLIKMYDLKFAVFMAELNLDKLLELKQSECKFKPLPLYPAIRRDIAFLVPETVSHEEIYNAIQEANLPLIESIELFDVYRGPNLPNGFKSMAYAIIYRSSERTLRDEEVNILHEKLMNYLQKRLNVTIRGS